MADATTKLTGPPRVDPAVAAARADRFNVVERSLRLWSGIVLFAFVTTHLLNHAVGIMGVEAMEVVQGWRQLVWRNLIGSVLLYGAAVVHIILVTKRITSRRTWRMPLQEVMQIALGLSIPILLYEHVIGTRYVASFAGVNDQYAATLQHLYPGKFIFQTTMLLIVWVHGVIGIHYAVRAHSWYPKWREFLLVLAVLVPVISLAGFVAGAREALEIGHEGAIWNEEQRAAFINASRWVNWGLFAFAGGIALTIGGLAVARRFGRQIPVRYTGHGLISLPKGSTLLEGSRENGIPHPSLCGGRARCSTCRVYVSKGAAKLPPPGPAEAQMLKRISAPPRVRLACQIRPTASLKVQILLPLTTTEGDPELSDHGIAMGTQREATVLFVDLRGFSKLVESQLPYDLVVLLNRFIGEMRQAVEAHEGRVTMVQTDGLMAVFGLTGRSAAGSRDAIAASRAMLKAVDAMNEELHAALTIPLRIGIGVHKGPIVVGKVGDDTRGFNTAAMGDSVTVASRLEAATKGTLVDCLVSQETFVAAGQALPSGERRTINVPGLDAPILAYSLTTDFEIEASDDEVPEREGPEGERPDGEAPMGEGLGDRAPGDGEPGNIVREADTSGSVEAKSNGPDAKPKGAEDASALKPASKKAKEPAE